MKLFILQPEVPHYRHEFFARLQSSVDEQTIYVYNSIDDAKKSGFNVSTDGMEYIKNHQIHGILLYSPWKLLRADVMVLMLHFAHLTTWLLLLTKWIHRKKIVLWGQGISVKRYLQEEIKPDWKLKLMMRLADGVWLYTDKELEQWRKIFPKKPMVALNNSLTGVDEMLEYQPAEPIETLKEKYSIKEQIVLIFCARFESNYRRTDLLVETIEKLDSEKYGFIIIGAGKNKPDFAQYKNVHDFGAVYDTNIKRELFSIADMYYQPGWVGLSIVEAMAYGKPILTFKRTEETKQCVEYSYITDGENGMIFETMDDCLKKINGVSTEEITRMSANAKSLVKSKLRPELMARSAMNVVNMVAK